jgi:hypothetical protein
MSLKNCIAKVGGGLTAGEKNEILENFDKYRGLGLSELEAGNKALDDYHKYLFDLLDSYKQQLGMRPSEYVTPKAKPTVDKLAKEATDGLSEKNSITNSFDKHFANVFGEAKTVKPTESDALTTNLQALADILGDEVSLKMVTQELFDQQKYAKIKPILQNVYDIFANEVNSIDEAMLKLLQTMKEKGFKAESVLAMRPFIIQFIRDVQTKTSEKTADYGTIEKPNVLNIANAFADRFRLNNGFKTIVEARKFASDLLGENIQSGTKEAKTIEEIIELGVVIRAREIANSNQITQQKYDDLVKLYELQPNLAGRTSTSIAQQAYSTPAPLAFVASQLAGITNRTSVYEPSAGNGMLLIGANSDNTWVNELNPKRADSLTTMFGTVTRDDASTFQPDTDDGFEVIIANPPFGVVKDEDGNSKTFDLSREYKTKELDHAIAFNALGVMKDDGRAVLIVGGVSARTAEGKSDAYNGKAKRDFYYTLYNQYNVTDHFTVSGNLYAKQGASFPVDVIVIDGRGKSALKLPAAVVPRVYSSWNELKEVLDETRNNELDANQRTDIPNAKQDSVSKSDSNSGSQRTTDGQRNVLPSVERTSARNDRQSGKSEIGKSDDLQSTGRNESRGQSTTDRRDGSAGTNLQQLENEGVTNQSRNNQESAENTLGNKSNSGTDSQSDRLGNVAQRNNDNTTRNQQLEKPKNQEKVDTVVTQVPYKPKSKTNSVNTLVPRNMQTAVQDALSNLENKVGSIDEYIADKLNYPVDKIGDYFSAEQVDALALALSNIERGKGFIIGDQTGIGKGRVVAGVMKYALEKGLTPIFVTEKPNLYKDIYRDLQDIGVEDIRPIMTNAGEKIFLDDAETNFIKSSDSKTHGGLLRKIANEGETLDYNMVFTTYAQMQTVKGGQRTVRHDFLEALAGNSIIVFDESHNAGGNVQAKPQNALEVELTRAEFARRLSRQSQGVMFSSATYAKRPEVMDLYAKTDISLAVKNIADLPTVINEGGVPLQQVVASMLSEAGQYIRRERSFDGIEYSLMPIEVSKESAENIATVMRLIQQFDEIKNGAVAGIDKELKAEGKKLSGDGSTGGSGASSLNFTSLMHNLIDQMLLTLKIDAVADEVIKSFNAGEKPVVTVANTMGSFIAQYVEDNDLQPNDAMALSFGDLLGRYLERSRDVIEGKPYGKKTRRTLEDEELGKDGVEFFNRVQNAIDAADWSNIPISPIDWLHHRLASAGIRSGEVTGRRDTIDYSDLETPRYKIRPGSQLTPTGRNRIVSAFNNGTLDVLILNQAGSTGLSAHASPRFQERPIKKRRMFIAQAEKNIDTHMQMLGRVNRTGQEILPAYSQMVANIPAEIRPAAVLAKKMASLNANTTASRESKVSSSEVFDFINAYGDKVIAEMMFDSPDVHAKLGNPLKYNDSGTSFETEGAARKTTGRIPLLPLKEQEALYKRIETAYVEYIEQLEVLGENALSAKTLDLDAKTVSTTTIYEGNGESPFSQSAVAAVMDIKRIGKPYTRSQVLTKLSTSLDEDVTDKTIEEIVSIAVAQGKPLIDAAEADFKNYKQDRLDSTPEAKIEAEEAKLRGQQTLWHNRIIYLMPGARILLESKNGSYYGIVTDVKRGGQTSNPLAPGDWKVTVAVADNIKQLVLPLSKLAHEREFSSVLVKNEAIGGDKIVFSRVATVPFEGQKIDVLDYFDNAQGSSRETRTIITGNLMAGFGKFKKGQIIYFTDTEGQLNQGILMPKDFNLEKSLQDENVVFTEPSQIIKFLTQQSGLLVKSSDKVMRVSHNWGTFTIAVPASKAQGGSYYLNQKILNAAGRDFVKSGNSMVLKVEQNTALQVLEAAKAQGVEFETDTYKDVAKRIVNDEGQPLFKIAGNQTSADMRQLKAYAKKGELTELLPDVESRVNGDELKLSLEASEVVRSIVSVIENRKREDVPILAGQFLNPEQVETLSKSLDVLADTIEANGHNRQPIDDLRTNLETASEKNGTVLVNVFDDAVPHEKAHQISYLDAAHEAKILTNRIKDLKGFVKTNSEVLQTAFNNYYSKHGYNANQHATLVEEIAVSIMTADYAKLGLNSQQAAEFLLNWFNAYEQQNGENSLKNFAEFVKGVDLAENAINEVKNAKNKEKSQNDENIGSPQSKQTSAESRTNIGDGKTSRTDGENERLPDRSEEIERRKKIAENYEKTNQQINNEAQKVMGEKPRQFAQTLADTGRASLPLTYLPESFKQWKQEAESIIKKEGLDGAVNRYFSDTTIKPSVKNALGIALTDLLGEAGKISTMNAVVTDMVTNATDTAQALVSLNMANKYDPKSWQVPAAALKKQSNRDEGNLTKEELKEGKEKVTSFAGASEDLAISDNRIEELEKENEQLAQTNQKLSDDARALKRQAAAESRRADKLKELSNDWKKEAKSLQRQLASSSRVVAPKVSTTEKELKIKLEAARTDNLAILKKYLNLNESPLFMVAWHGSPHVFDKFDISKIGTGEGANSHGYGIYFTDSKSLADFYKDTLSKEKDTRGATYSVRLQMVKSELIDWDADFDMQSPEVKQALSKIQPDIRQLNEIEWEIKRGDATLRIQKNTETNTFDLYGVNKLSSSPSFTEAGKSANKILTTLPIGLNGNNIYQSVKKQKGSPKAASDYLKSLGIRGIKFLDGTSRKDGEGSYNYVIFDDADVEIEEILKSVADDSIPFESEEIFNAFKGLAVLKLLNVMPHASMSVSEFRTWLDDLTNKQLTNTQIDKIFVGAMNDLQTAKEHNLTDEQKAKNTIRREFYSEAKRIVDAPKKAEKELEREQNSYTRNIVRVGEQNGASDETILGAVLLRHTHNLSDWVKLMDSALNVDDAGNRQLNFTLKDLEDVFIKSTDLKREAWRDLERHRIANKNKIDKNSDEAKAIQEIKRAQITQLLKSRNELNQFYSNLRLSKEQTFGKKVGNIVNLPRNLQTSVDVSAGGRQAMPLNILQTKASLKGVIAGTKASLTEDAYYNRIFELENDPIVQEMQEYGASFRSVAKNPLEFDDFFQSNLLHKVGQKSKLAQTLTYPFEASERAFLLAGDEAMIEVYKKWAEMADSLPLSEQQKETNKKTAIKIINAAIGRGNIKAALGTGGYLQQAMNQVFYAARYNLSTPELLYQVATAPLRNTGNRSFYLRKATRLYGGVGLMMVLVALAGFTSLDPEDDEFMQVRFGDAKFNPLGNLKEGFRFMAMAVKMGGYSVLSLSSDAKTSKMGQEGMLRTGTWMTSGWLHLLRAKLSPQASLVVDAVVGSNYLGREFTWSHAIASRMIPLSVQALWNTLSYDRQDSMLGIPSDFHSFWENIKELPTQKTVNNLKYLPTNIFDFFGMSSNVYPKEPSSVAMDEARFAQSSDKYESKPSESDKQIPSVWRIDKRIADVFSPTVMQTWRVKNGIISLIHRGYDAQPVIDKYKSLGIINDEDIKDITKKGGRLPIENKLDKGTTDDVVNTLLFADAYRSSILNRLFRQNDSQSQLEKERLLKMLEKKAESANKKGELTADELKNVQMFLPQYAPPIKSDKPKMATPPKIKAPPPLPK